MRCECGAALHRVGPGRLVCIICAWRDGATAAERELISALRVCGGRAGLDALALEVGEQMSERTMFRALAKLRALRRIVVEYEDGNEETGRATYVLRTSRLGA